MRLTRISNRFALLIALVLLAAGTGATPNAIIQHPLSGAMPNFSSVFDYDVTTDGKTAVFYADREVDGKYELYSVPIGPFGSPVKISGAMVYGGKVKTFDISPDDQRVVYRADQETAGKIELYSVPVAGGLPVRLNPGFPSYKDVVDFEISADSQWVMMRVAEEGGKLNTLLMAPIAGGAWVDLASNVHIDGEIHQAQIAPSSQRVVYSAMASSSVAMELYSVLKDGTDRHILSGILGSYTDSNDFIISPDSTRVIYTAQQDSPDANELYSVPIGGGTITKLNLDFANYRSVINFEISPDSQYVVYQADQDTAGLFELYTVPAAGGTAKKVSGNLIPAGDVDWHFEITPNSQGVVFTADAFTDAKHDLFSNYIDSRVRETPFSLKDPALSGSQNVYNFVITPNGLGVVYVSDHLGGDVLFSILITGGTPHQLTPPVPNVRIYNPQVTPNSQAVVFSTDYPTAEMIELYSVPITGGPRLKWNRPNLHPEGDVNNCSGYFLDNHSVVYLSDAVVDEKWELYYASPGWNLFVPQVKK